ncbi:MAG TPA: DUF5916 domain-containing protein [Chryseosolibacter sp.]
MALCIASPLLAQRLPGTELIVKKSTGPIKLDGELNEPDWVNAVAADKFFQNYPNDSLPATNQSEAFLTFDDRYLYFAFKCYTKKPITQNMRRDFGNALVLHDVIYLNVGGFADKANGNWFGVSYPGVQYDGAISNGGDSENSYTDFWDAKWYTKTKKFDGYWVAESAIPFKSFRYSNSVPLDINFLRGDASTNERSHWVRVPVQYMVGTQAFQGKMKTDHPLPTPGKNVVVIPYSTFSSTRENDQTSTEMKGGFDAKIGIATAMNLDITLNPDFSHVEVDQQIVNFTRFEFNFPERRQFFLENSDLFGQLGLPFARPFFTRRIGLASDSTGTLRKVPILYGVRFSGKPSNAWRIGIMNLHTRQQESIGLPDQNYTMGVAQYRVLSRSYFSLFYINKQNVNVSERDSSRYLHPDLWYQEDESGSAKFINRFNRVAGAEFNLLTTSNKWSGKIFYHHAMNSFKENKRGSYGLISEYNTRDWGLRFIQQSTERNFRAETGFVPALNIYHGFHNSTLRMRRSYYPINRKLIKAEPYAEGNINLVADGSLTDHSMMVGTQFFFLNQASIKAEARNWFQKLPMDFNPINPTGDSTLLKGQQFSWRDADIQVFSDPRKKLSYSIGYGVGGFYNGNRQSYYGELVFRTPPYVTLSAIFNYSRIELPEAYGQAGFLLVSPKIDITFTPNLFLTTLLQYNDRFDNVNLNARLQWRYKPLSDLFIVYTEDYFPNGFASKQRALVFKATYWLNL